MSEKNARVRWARSKRSKDVTPAIALLDHQRATVNHLLNHRGALVYHSMGSGKTRLAVALVALLKTPALVVLPASLQENFRQEVRRLRVPERYFTILSSHAFLRRMESTTPLDATGQILIIDEAHTLRNPDGKISRRVVACARQAHKVLLLTGTPVINRPRDVAPLLNMIVAGHIDLTVGPVWNRHTFTELPTGQAFDRLLGADGLNSLAQRLWSALLPCVFSYYAAPEHSPDFPRVQPVVRELPLSADQVTVYKAWEARALTPAMARMLAHPQATLDLSHLPQFRAYLDGGRRIGNAVTVDGRLSAPKFVDLVQNVQRLPGPALVYSHYLTQGLTVAERLLTQAGLSCVKFTGEQTAAEKADAVARYNRGQVRVFLLSTAGSLGLDLHNTTSVHVMEPGWNEGEILQAVARAVRYKSHPEPGATVTVFRYYTFKPYVSTTPSADLYLLRVSRAKAKVNREFLDFAIKHSMEAQGPGSCTLETL